LAQFSSFEQNRFLQNGIHAFNELPDIVIVQAEVVQLSNFDSLLFGQVLSKPLRYLILVGLPVFVEDLVHRVADVQDDHLQVDE
jgi:hypothetical protein